jgi:Mg2+ and Co2+ transporter CorA
MIVLKGRVGLIDDEVESIRDLIKMEFRLAGRQRARMSRDIAELQRNVCELRGNVGELRDLLAKVEAMPMVVAELVVELLSERDRRR